MPSAGAPGLDPHVAVVLQGQVAAVITAAGGHDGGHGLAAAPHERAPSPYYYAFRTYGDGTYGVGTYGARPWQPGASDGQQWL